MHWHNDTGTCPGDLTGHFKVDSNDFFAFVSAYINYYSDNEYDAAADFNHDGVIDSNDFFSFVSAYISYNAGPTPFVNNELTLTTNLQNNSYDPGDPVNFTLSVNNVGDSPITVSFSSSTFDFIVYNSTSIVYRYSSEMVYPLTVQIVSLLQKQVYPVTWIGINRATTSRLKMLLLLFFHHHQEPTI